MKVALAGASSGVGRHITESIIKHAKHELIILSRHEIPEFSNVAAVKIVSYDDQQTVIDALSGVHTVVSALGNHSQSGNAQLVLVQAAIAAGVTRFIPSGWSGTDGGKDDVIELYRFQQPALEALRQSSLQWSFPQNGIFINYFASPKAGRGHLKPLKFWIDVENCTATIPGDGNKKLVYTTVEDVGEFVAHVLDVADPWPETLSIVGCTTTHNELVAIAEKIQGKKFSVTYVTEEEYEAKIVPNPPSIMVNMATKLSIALLHNRFTFSPNMNDKVVMKYTTPEEFIQKWWGGEAV